MKKILLILLLILCTGCYDYNELNEIAIISGVGIDKLNNEYVVTYEVINTEASKESSNDIKKYNVKGNGGSLSEAFNNVNETLAKKAYFEQIKVMVITKNVNILDISDYLFRNEKINTNFYLVLCNDIDEIFDFTSVNEPNNSIAIYNLLKQNDYANITNLFDLKINTLIEGYDISLPLITLDNELSLKTIGIYNNNKFIRYLNDNEYRIYKYLSNKKDILINSNDNSIKIYNSKLNYNLENNSITLKYEAKAEINSLNISYDLRDINSYNELSNEFTTVTENEITNFIKQLQIDNSDILNILNKYKLKYPDSSITFKDLTINYDINVKVDKAGTAFKEVK